MCSKIFNILFKCINNTNKEYKGSQHKKNMTENINLYVKMLQNWIVSKHYIYICNMYMYTYIYSCIYDYELSGLPCAAAVLSSARLSSKATSEVIKCNFWLHLCEEKVLHRREPSPWTPGPRHSGPVFCSPSFSIVNEEDRRGRGLLVLIYPEGSLGITINSPLPAHSTSLHRHCQFVPIREAGFWVSAVRSRSGPTGESDPDHTGLDYTSMPWGVENSAWVGGFPSYIFWSPVR